MYAPAGELDRERVAAHTRGVTSRRVTIPPAAVPPPAQGANRRRKQAPRGAAGSASWAVQARNYWRQLKASGRWDEN